ncbi:MAG TPA: protein translocase subunit SecD, partial [Spirochaetales bacterium]|nr:protein translocase subunit SecD [Spirochaetales bacterium]
MNKTKRFLIVLAVLAVAFAFLFPSIQWYFLTPKEDQALALGSREQIREYAWRMARTDLTELEKLAKAGSTEALSGHLADLVPASRIAYKQLGMKLPATWTAQSFLAPFDDQTDALSKVEDLYRERMLKLKNLHGNAVQLGLDLSGGMSIVIRADLPALEERQGRALSAAEKDDAVVRA